MNKLYKTIPVLLTLLFVGTVNAEYVKKGDINYILQNEFYCGENEAIPEEYIEKTGKLKVRVEIPGEEVAYYIWNEGNICTPYTTQDELDTYNSLWNVYHIDYGDPLYTMSDITTDTYYETGYIKATGDFDPNGEYFESMGFFGLEPVTTPDENNFDNYYVKILLKHVDNAEIDSNLTYYSRPDHWTGITAIIDENDLDAENITNYFVKTSLEELNYTVKESTMEASIYTNLKGLATTRVYDLVSLNGVMYAQIFGYNDDVYYYDANGEEVVKYRNYLIKQNSNYTVYQDFNNKKIIVYDGNEENIIYENTYTGDDTFSTFKLTKTSLLLYSYVDGELQTTYINLYKPLEGDKQTFSDKDITIRFNGNFDAFKELKINDVVVPTDKYTVTKGSTIITISKDYLSTLASGTYNVKAIYSDGGEALATFTIAAEESNPNTIDNNILYITIGLISLSGLYIVYKKEA